MFFHRFSFARLCWIIIIIILVFVLDIFYLFYFFFVWSRWRLPISCPSKKFHSQLERLCGWDIRVRVKTQTNVHRKKMEYTHTHSAYTASQVKTITEYYHNGRTNSNMYTHSDFPLSAKKNWYIFFFIYAGFFSNLTLFLPIHRSCHDCCCCRCCGVHIAFFQFVVLFCLRIAVRMPIMYFLCIMLSVPFVWKFMVRRTSICSVRWLHQVNIFVAILSVYLNII